MIRTIVTLLVLFAAVLWFPLWVQLALMVAALFVLPQRLFLLFPAVFADAYYGPARVISFGTFRMTAIALVLLIIFWLIMTKTRLGEMYGVATE